MDYVLAWQSVGGGYFSGTGVTPVEAATFGEEGGTGGGVDRAVLEVGMLGRFEGDCGRLGGGRGGSESGEWIAYDAAATEERLVCCIYDGSYGERRD